MQVAASSSSRNYYQLYNERVRFVCTALVLHGNKLAAGRVLQPPEKSERGKETEAKVDILGFVVGALSMCVCYTTRCDTVAGDLDSPAGFPDKPLFLYNIPPPTFTSAWAGRTKKVFSFPPAVASLLIHFPLCTHDL